MSETRAVTLETSVDTTGARAGFTEIQREAGTMAAAVARASEQADTAVEGIGTSASTSARNVDASARNMINAIQRQTAALEAGSRSGSAYYEVLARQRGVDPAVLEPYLAQLRAIEQTQSRANSAVGGASQPLHQVGISAAQAAAALRQVPAQFTDIVTQLQGGQSPMTVLFQQGGQLRDMFGSAGGAARALGGYVMGLVTPFTVAAAVAAGLAYAYKKGRDEINAFNLAIISSGNRAGVTADQLSEMARVISATSGSRGAAAGALTALAQSGQVQASSLREFAQVAVEAQDVMGKKVEETVGEFEKLGRTPLQALGEISAKYHNVTAATYAQVKALQDQGRYAEAATVAQKAYADGVAAQKQKVLDSLTDWERGWIRLKNIASETVDKMLNVGRGATGMERINALLNERDTIQSNMDRAQTERDTRAVAAYQRLLDKNKDQINAIRDRQKAEKDAANAKEKADKADEVRNRWLTDEDVLLTRQAKLRRDLDAARTEGKINGLTEEEILKRQAVIRRQNYDVVVEGIERQIDAVNRLGAIEDIRSQRRLAQIAVARSAGSINEETAIQQAGAEDLAALDRQKSQLQQQLALIKQRVESEREQDALRGQIAEVNERRVSREKQLTNDLLLLDYQRFQASKQAVEQLYDQAASERDDLVRQVQAQKDYNEAIGLTAEQVLNLAAARREEQAVRLDKKADTFEGIDPEIAARIREQARQLRDLTAAQKEGFVKERDPYVNLRQSLNRYVEESQNSGALIGDALTNAFRSAEDAFANFVTTGKLNFKDFATSILADFARIQAKAAISGFAKSLFGSMGTDTSSGWGASLMQALGVSGARAAGGPVNSGLSYLVGEKGPEIFTPSTSGSITPNHMIGSGGSPITIQTNVNVEAGSASSTTTGDQASTGRALSEMINTKVKEVLTRESRQGGLIWKMQQGRA